MALWNFKSKDKFEDVDSVVIPTSRAENVPVTVVTPVVRPATSVIAAGAVVSGSLSAPGDIQIEGHVIGDVRCATVVVGKEGDVKGNVTAETATIRGRVVGNVRARTIQLAATGSVEGDLSHAVLIIEEGGVFEGRSKRAADPLNELALSAPNAEAPNAEAPEVAAETDVFPDTVIEAVQATPMDDKVEAPAEPAPLAAKPKKVKAVVVDDAPGKNLDEPARSGVADALGDQFAAAN
jgi:cytoskeletal protein CcmA (bactofilin family)